MALWRSTLTGLIIWKHMRETGPGVKPSPFAKAGADVLWISHVGTWSCNLATHKHGLM